MKIIQSFENTMNHTNYTMFDYTNRPYLFSLVLLSPISYFTNFLVLYVVIKIILKEYLKCKPYLLLANICVANVIAVTANIAITSLSVSGLGDDPLIDFVEKGVVLTPLLVSMWCVCLVTVERLIYIMCPVTYDNIVTSNRINALIILTWLFSIIIGFLPTKIIFKNFIQYDSDTIPAILIIQFSVATFLIIIMFTVIIMLYRFSVNLINNSKGLTMNAVIIRTLVFLLFTLLLFVLSWEPYLITSTVYYFHCNSIEPDNYPCEELWSTIMYPLPWITLFNSCINPNAYIWWYKPFMESFKIVLFPNLVRERKRLEAISTPISDI